jgi:enoyl-CoA hydratase
VPVHVERNGPVWTVVLDRPRVRNAVDRATGTALADAFRAFEARRSVYAAVPDRDALAREFEFGLATIRAGTDVARFVAGEGRGGSFQI